MAKVTIEVPDGYEVQVVEKKKEEQKENQAKPVIKTYQDLIDNKLEVKGYIITASSIVEEYFNICSEGEKDVAASKKIAKSMIAMAMISQLMPYYGGEITDKEWEDEDTAKYVIIKRGSTIDTDWYYNLCLFLAFHTKEQRDEFLKYNEQLVKDYLMIE